MLDDESRLANENIDVDAVAEADPDPPRREGPDPPASQQAESSTGAAEDTAKKAEGEPPLPEPTVADAGNKEEGSKPDPAEREAEEKAEGEPPLPGATMVIVDVPGHPEYHDRYVEVLHIHDDGVHAGKDQDVLRLNAFV